MKPIGPGLQRKWKVLLNGVEVPEVQSLELTSCLGTLHYGDAGGYDWWNFHENGGGGACIVPYIFREDACYIGMISQLRPNQGKTVWNIPRGFLNLGETHFGAATRELREETGYSSFQLQPLGVPQNSNSAFFVTTANEGVQFFGLEVEHSDLVKDGAEFVFSPLNVKPVTKTDELIFSCRFHRLDQALQTSDMFTLAGIGLVLGARAR